MFSVQTSKYAKRELKKIGGDHTQSAAQAKLFVLQALQYLQNFFLSCQLCQQHGLEVKALGQCATSKLS